MRTLNSIVSRCLDAVEHPSEKATRAIEFIGWASAFAFIAIVVRYAQTLP